ncbi:hypothetical protein ACPV34_07290 [Photobacterium damselae]|uniref:hypothetical protein n=1 Tax=Photobacterium damselae TaxID=38293 RepID=UPI003907527E
MNDIIIAAMSIVGVLIAFVLGERKSSREQKKYKENLWLELEDIREDLKFILGRLLDEFRHPVRSRVIKPLEIDWGYLNDLQKGLGADIPFPIRKALKEIKLYDEVVKSVINKKNDKVKQQENGKVLINYQLSARAILETSKLLYVIFKLLEVKDNYKLGTGLDVQDVMRSVFNTIDQHREISDAEIERIYNSALR